MSSAGCASNDGSIGVAGRLARLVVGVIFIGLALFWRDPDWFDFVLGLVVAPLFVIGLLAFRAYEVGRPLRATGPLGHAANLIILIPLFAWPVTAGAAFLFYGASMLFAAARAAGTCEVTAISNAVLGRNDQIGCPLFWPVDAAEAKFADRSDQTVESR
jgi:hypothetical protein